MSFPCLTRESVQHCDMKIVGSSPTMTKFKPDNDINILRVKRPKTALSRYCKYVPRIKYKRSAEVHRQSMGFFSGSIQTSYFAEAHFLKISEFKIKKARNRSEPCPSGNREHGWEGKMFPIYLLSTSPPEIFNRINKIL